MIGDKPMFPPFWWVPRSFKDLRGVYTNLLAMIHDATAAAHAEANPDPLDALHGELAARLPDHRVKEVIVQVCVYKKDPKTGAIRPHWTIYEEKGRQALARLLWSREPIAVLLRRVGLEIRDFHTDTIPIEDRKLKVQAAVEAAIEAPPNGKSGNGDDSDDPNPTGDPK